MYSAQALSFGEQMSARADELAGEGLGLDFLTIAALFVQMLPVAEKLFAACQKQPPTPPPVPVALSEMGVTEEIWAHANGVKYAAQQSAGSYDSGFSKFAVMESTRQIRKAQHIKKKAARPLAIAALEAARDRDVETIAEAMLNARNNAAV